MMTVRQIERSWNAKDHAKLFRELVAARIESSFRLETEMARAPLAAAMALIRLEELSQSHVPLYVKLLKAILASQDADGGWGEPVATALCLRALSCGRGNGLAVERGMRYLANLQKDEGIWSNLPIRRMPADPHVSAFILYQLGDNPLFRESVRFRDAVVWFEGRDASLEEETFDLWDHARRRCRVRGVQQPMDVPIWSIAG